MDNDNHDDVITDDPQNVTKLFPGWKEAAYHIAAEVERDGYGRVYSFATLYQLMDIKKPAVATAAEWRDSCFEVLQHTENLKKLLLEEHSICLHNVRGVGYQVLHPDDQVTVAAERLFKLAMAKIRKVIDVVTHVDVTALSAAGQKAQLQAMNKSAFLRAAMGSKKNLGGAADDQPKLTGPETEDDADGDDIDDLGKPLKKTEGGK